MSVQEELEAHVKDILELRKQRDNPLPNSDPSEVLDALSEIRQCRDRIEEIYLRILVIHGSIDRKLRDVTFNRDRAWAEAIENIRKSSVQRGDSFTGPRERYAEADLVTLNEKREVKKYEDLISIANDALEIAKTVLRGIDATRQDYLTWLRTLQFQSHLEI